MICMLKSGGVPLMMVQVRIQIRLQFNPCKHLKSSGGWFEKVIEVAGGWEGGQPPHDDPESDDSIRAKI